MEKDKEEKTENKLSDIFKKVVTTGVSAAFMTEESVKNMVKDLPLPKDLVNSLLDNAKSTKTEFVTGIKNELKSYLDKVDISKEIEKIVEKYDFEIKATISLKPKSKKSDKSK